MDAAIAIYPAFLKANAEIGTAGIINSFGYTEATYKGPAGEGAGILLPAVKKSPFYPGRLLPASLVLDRQRRDPVASDPAIVTAFLVAAAGCGRRAVGKMKPGDVSELVAQVLGAPPELGAKVVEDDVLFQRGWCWPTEGDAAALLETSKFMVEGKLITKPLTWRQVKVAFAQGGRRSSEGLRDNGHACPTERFTAKDAKDLRGAPVWQMNSWKARA